MQTCIKAQNTNMYVSVPNRNYITVCIKSNKVICSLSQFYEHCTHSVPWLAAYRIHALAASLPITS